MHSSLILASINLLEIFQKYPLFLHCIYSLYREPNKSAGGDMGRRRWESHPYNNYWGECSLSGEIMTITHTEVNGRRWFVEQSQFRGAVYRTDSEGVFRLFTLVTCGDLLKLNKMNTSSSLLKH